MPLVCFRPYLRTAQAANLNERKKQMAKTKQGKPDAKAAATEKAKGANPSGAAGKATGRKAKGAAQAAAQSDNVPELLREVIQALGVIAARVESVRRTLWRMSEIRNYENKGGKGDKSGAGAEGTKQAMIKLLGELYYPHWENFVQDISSGRIDTAPEYAELRALPDWAAFRASFDADAGKPEAADAGKPEAKGGKR